MTETARADDRAPRPPASEGRTSETRKGRAHGPIVPGATVAGRALVAVVAIMTFLAALTAGTVLAVRATTASWRADVGREVTIQLRAGKPEEMEAQVRAAAEVARAAPGIAAVEVLSPAETSKLLEPWLGTGLDLSDLPVPRILVLKLGGSGQADLAALKRTLSDRIPAASLDDHRVWSSRLGMMAEGVMATGIGLVILVGLATVLSVVFATRAAVATNRSVVEVLHFVGARDGFIAAQFQRHFLRIGAEGGAIGGAAAAALFLAVAGLPRLGIAAEGEGPSFLAWLDPGVAGYLAIAGIVVLAALATALTSRITVYRTLRSIK